MAKKKKRKNKQKKNLNKVVRLEDVIAAFNLKEYAFAAKCWEKMSRGDKYPEGVLYANIARWVEQGIIPPFTVDYELESGFVKMRNHQIQEVMELDDTQKEQRQLDAEKQRLAEAHFTEISSHLNKGEGKLAILAEFFQAMEQGCMQHAVLFIDMLLLNTGAWGFQLVRNLVQDPGLQQELREEINRLLEDETTPDEEITLYGEAYKVVFDDKRLGATYDMARELRRRKRSDEAKDMILQAMNRKKATNPELVMLLSSLESAKGEWQLTLDLMIELEKALPGNPAVLYNQVLAYSKLKEWGDALGVLEDLKMIVKIEEAEGTELLSRYTSKGLEKLEKSILQDRGVVERTTIGDLNKPDHWAGLGLLSAQELKGMVEAKNLPKKTSLRRGRKNMPVEWVRFACQQYNLKTDGLREELEAALEERLGSGDGLKNALEALDPGEKEVLGYLLKKGGTAGTSYLVRKHGSMEEDGYFWDEGDKPASTLGRLWSKCLIMVGRGLVNGKRQKVALIPTDLLPHIQKHFSNT